MPAQGRQRYFSLTCLLARAPERDDLTPCTDAASLGASLECVIDQGEVTMASTNPKTYESTPPRQVAFLGLGVMGSPMAGHLSPAGHDVRVYNRSAEKSRAWTGEFKGTSAATPREAVAGRDIVFCCVGTDDALRSVVLGDNGALAGMKPGAIFVDHTTASANVARELAAEAQMRGMKFVDAPVSGGQAGAQNGMLTVMCGGDADAFDAAKGPAPL